MKDYVLSTGPDFCRRRGGQGVGRDEMNFLWPMHLVTQSSQRERVKEATPVYILPPIGCRDVNDREARSTAQQEQCVVRRPESRGPCIAEVHAY